MRRKLQNRRGRDIQAHGCERSIPSIPQKPFYLCKMTRKTSLLLLCNFLCVATTIAQPADTLLTDILPAISVRATRSSIKSDANPLAVSVLNAARIRDAQVQLTLAESLPSVPGVFVLGDANFAQDLRISIRGFGARAGFGIRGIKILLDGIPESSPDGQAQVDNLDPAMLQRIEVLRGPSSGLYGNAAGGVISMSTEAPETTSNLQGRIVAGSYGFRQYHLKGGFRAGQTAFKIGVTQVNFDGFRNHSTTKSTLATIKMNWSPASDSSLQLTVLANYTDNPQSDDPGALTAAQDSVDRRAANPVNVQFNAGESLRQLRLAAIVDKKISPQSHFNIRFWAANRNFENRLPFRNGGQVAFQRAAMGGTAQFEYQSKIKSAEGEAKYKFSAGLESDLQSDMRQRFDNNDGLRGMLNLRQEEIFSGLGIFVIGHWQALNRVSISGGARADRIRLRAFDLFFVDGDQSGSRFFQSFNPWLGAAWRLQPRLNLYANLTTNFETPTLTELSNPTGRGGFSASLKPQRTLSTELGLRGRGQKQLSWELVVFQARTRDELTPFELQDQPGRTFYQNAGQSLRRGVEVALSFSPILGLDVWTNYTFSDFRFEQFSVSGSDFAGKTLPGLPQHFGQVTARYSHSSGLLAQVSGQFTGSFFAENANAVSIPATQVFSARLAWRGKFWKVKSEVFLGSDNFTNVHVFNNIRLNAAAGRYYESGAGRRFFCGLQFGF